MGDFGYIRQPSVAEGKMFLSLKCVSGSLMILFTLSFAAAHAGPSTASQQALPPCLPYDETPNSPTAAPLLSPNNGSHSLPYINGNCRFPGQQQTYIYGKSPERDVGSAEHFDSFPASHLHGQPVHRDSAACPRPSDTPKLDALAVWSGLLRTPDPQIALNAASREGEAPIGAVEHEVLGFGTTQTRDLVPRGCPTAAAPDLFW